MDDELEMVEHSYNKQCMMQLMKKVMTQSVYTSYPTN